MRKREWDVLRGFAILGVLLVHVSAFFITSPSSPLTSLLSSLNLFSTFAIPLFFIISGCVLSLFPPGDLLSFYGRRVKAVLPPYLIFSFLAMLLFSGFS